MNKLYVIPPLFLQPASWILIRLFLLVFCSFEVKGLDKSRFIKGKVIFASNHATEFDPVLILASFPFLSRFLPVFYTSLEKKFYSHCGWKKHIYGGIFFKMWGAYPVYKGLYNYEKALKHHIRILKDNNSLCIFPEGRKYTDGACHEVKGGVAFLCHKTDTPVVPVSIYGVKDTNFKNFLFRKNKIIIYFGKPLYWSDIYKKENYTELDNFQDVYKQVSQYIMSKIYDGVTKS